MSPPQLTFSWARNTALNALTCKLLGTSLIEASAGTGKTFAITTLYVRLLLERELSVGEILVVTYTRAATAELRDRIRKRLRQAQRALDAGFDADDSDMDALAKARSAKGSRAEDQKRLTMALRSFDQASIFTIHSFCQRVLQDSAFESGAEFDTSFLSDQAELVAEIGNDFWAREMYAADPALVRLLTASKKPITPESLIDLARKATQNPTMPILPTMDVRAIASAQEQWTSAQERASEIWSQDREEILALLDGSPDLKKGQYKPGQVSGPWAASMDQTLRPGKLGIPSEFKHFSKFTTTGVALGTKKYHTPPAHPFFAACDELEALRALTENAKMATYLELTRYARTELAARKRNLAVQSFDDLLQRLSAALDGDGGPRLAAAIRSRFPGALIDEFQDTDPMQYRIFDCVYGDASSVSLFLIGDPKQAIYAFRGADVFAYMEARKAAGENRHSLGTNWRSDPKLVRAINTVFSSAQHSFVFDEIEFEEVAPSSAAKDCLRGLDDQAALQILFVDSADKEGQKGRIPKAWGDRHVPTLTAQAIAGLLSSGATITAPQGGKSPVSPGDIAVLVRKNQQALDVQEALRGLNVPSVVEGNASVFETAEAEQLERILIAIAEPGSGRALVSALTTPVLGMSGDEVSSLRSQEEVWDVWLGKFRAWHQTWNENGFIQAFRKLLGDQEVPQRLLSRPSGERRLTNLYHLGELLQAQATELKLGPEGLVRWMYRMRTDGSARVDQIGDTGQMRLESDTDAVKLVTIHKSKGLEYPIVYCPFLWDGRLLFKHEKDSFRFHDPDEGDRLKLDIGSKEIDEHRRIAEREALAENLRLLYVALTRAKHMCSVVWGNFSGSETSPLAYLWHQEPGSQATLDGLDRAASYVKELDDEALRTDLAKLCAGSGGAISVITLEPRSAKPYSGAHETGGVLQAREAVRRMYPRGRFSSFSALISGERGEGDERDVDSTAGHTSLPAAAHESNSALATQESPRVRLADFPKGARIGVMMHEVFEHTDFSDESGASVVRATQDAFLRYGLNEEAEARFLPAMRDALKTPLASARVVAMPRLCDLSKDSRLDELEFLFPVSQTGSALRASCIARVLADHPNAPWPAWYPDEVAKLDFLPLKGFMRGFVDLIFCHQERWYLADYKSNFLGATVSDYRPEALAQSMADHHYFLQYLVYIVALHRYLQARLPQYDYAQHMGGVFYLFVRGMSPDNPKGTGVFGDLPPLDLVEALSERFDQGAST